MASLSNSPPPAKRLKLASSPLAPPHPAASSSIPSNHTPTAASPTPHHNSSETDNFDSSLELKVGITEYLNPNLSGFTGILKQRYTDFLVNEITSEGEVVHLKSIDALRRERDAQSGEKRKDGVQDGVDVVKEGVDSRSKVDGVTNIVVEQEILSGDGNSKVKEETNIVPAEGPGVSESTGDVSGPTPAQKEIPVITISPEDHAELLSLLGEEALKSLLTLYITINTSAATPAGPTQHHIPVLTPKIDSKESRTAVHRSIRRIFSGKFDTTTLEGTGNEGIISISVSRNTGHTSRGGRPERGGRGGKRGGGGGGRGGDREKGERQDPYPNGQYLHFTLHKENRDTMELVNMLGRILNLPRQLQQKTFGFAGTKDKRAVTVQRVSAFKVNPERLAGVNSASVSGRGGRGGGRGGRGGGAMGFGLPRGCKVGDFEWKKTGLELGDLKGNEFLITLRDVSANGNAEAWSAQTLDEQEAQLRDIVGAAMSGLEKNGFINYYGLQRFGTFAKGTHDVGVKMLRMDWKGAVDEIMHFDTELTSLPDDSKLQVSRDEFDRARALKILTKAIVDLEAEGYDEKLQEASFILPKKFLAENAILNAAKDKVGGSTKKLDWLQCLMRIPRGLRMMYIHSYQSYIWNHVSSERVRRFGREGIVEGDLVLVDNKTSNAGNDEDVDMEDSVDQAGEPIIRDTSSSFQSLSAKLTKEEGVDDSGFQRARPISAEEAASGKFSIRDIVLPTPGYDIEYPNNELKQVYIDLMAKDGLDPLQMRRSVREVSLSGAYRKVIGGVLGPVEWDVKRVRGLEQCVVTDLEKVMQERRGKRGRDSKDNDEENAVAVGEAARKMDVDGASGSDKEKKDEQGEDIKKEVIPEPQTAKLAVVLKMQLGTSMYATMALREVMKAGGVQSYQPEFGHGPGQGR